MFIFEMQGYRQLLQLLLQVEENCGILLQNGQNNGKHTIFIDSAGVMCYNKNKCTVIRFNKNTGA